MRRTLTSRGLLLAVLLPAVAAAAAGGVRWRGLEGGHAEARKTGKPVLYFFTADWCAPCHVLEERVFSDAEAARKVEKLYVPIILEDRRREEGANPAGMEALARAFGVQGFPTLVVTRPGDKGGLRLSGWAGRERTLDFIGAAAGRLSELEKEGAAKR
ncbi:MAG: thioredoxin family protein [Acidithiobacillales bacterium]